METETFLVQDAEPKYLQTTRLKRFTPLWSKKLAIAYHLNTPNNYNTIINFYLDPIPCIPNSQYIKPHAYN